MNRPDDVTLEAASVLSSARISHEGLIAIVDSIDEPVYVADPSTYELLFVNQATARIFGTPDGRRCHQYFQQRDIPCLFCTNDRIFGPLLGKSHVWEFCNERNKHWYRCIDKAIPWPDGRMVRYEMAIDITARKKAEEERERLHEQLLHAQKLESVGRLAGGIAHDFNNMLSVILGHIELALNRLPPADPLHQDLQNVQAAASRSADLTRQLLAFARRQTIAPCVLDLNETMSSLLPMLRRIIGENVILDWVPGADVPRVRVDPSQLDQILANLCVNARDAIKDTGRITIETGVATFDEAYCASHVGFLPGTYARLVVSDNGCGMDAATRARLFEPFFTTKAVGAGTGLGLSTVYGIVRQNRGFINLYSEPGRGSTFRIYLPRCIEDSEIRSEPTSLPRPAARGGTVLLVEDEAMILDVTRRMLELLGYTVLAAATPGEAIRMAREHADSITILMTDVIMPEMNGRDLAKNILTLHPTIRRLFMSGYTANVIAHHDVLDSGVHFLQKPFTRKELEQKLLEVLSEG